MALAPRLDLRQSQSLVMTPQLQQAIKLLAMSAVEIDAFVAEAVEANPLLEIVDGMGEQAAPEIAENIEARGSDEMMGDTAMSAGEALDADYGENSFNSDATPYQSEPASGGADGMLGMNGVGSGGGFEDGPDFDSFAANDISLRDHLFEQAGASLSGDSLFLVQQLIEQIEPTGYLRADLLATAHRLGVPVADMDEALAELQRFDPTGVGARDLAECLALQAKEADRYDPCMARLLDNLDLVAKGGFDQLKRLCRVDDEDLRDMLAELRGYDPKPGCRFDHDVTQIIVPDIFVRPASKKEGGWLIELNSASLPKLLVNRSYQNELKSNGADKADNGWLDECLADAHWLVRAMDQRQRTIIKVATEIVKLQDGFFRHGTRHLKPMTLRQIAEAIDMHESTISRVTSNKYLSCDRGLFDLKFFFTSGVGSSDGEGASAEAVKSHIKALIDAEEKILSDDTLVELLKAKGFDIARRTVAKYREAIGIGSSVERRRQKKMRG